MGVYDYYGDFGKSEVSGGSIAADDVTVNGMACWTCSDASYTDCATNGASHYCQDEQFHCYIEEEKHRNNVVRVEMGCKQDLACRRGWLQNSSGGNLGGVSIAGFNSADRVNRIDPLTPISNTNSQNNQCQSVSPLQSHLSADSAARVLV